MLQQKQEITLAGLSREALLPITECPGQILSGAQKVQDTVLDVRCHFSLEVFGSYNPSRVQTKTSSRKLYVEPYVF